MSHLGVNMSTLTSLALPASTYGSLPTVYPMAINGTTALWDASGSDALRKVIGLSPAGGVAIFSGDDETTGSGIRLNSAAVTTSGVTTTGQPAGSVQTLSYGNGAASTLAYSHLNFNSSSSTTQSLLRLWGNGDLAVTGKLSMPMLGGDVAYRQIEAASTNYGLDIFANNSSAPDCSIRMSSSGATNPNSMTFNAYATAGLNFAFKTSASAYALRIDPAGNTRLGDYPSFPSPADRLTVDGDLFINNDNGVDRFRNIFARSTIRGINVTSGSNTDGSDGACFTAMAMGAPAGMDPGSFTVKTYGVSSANGKPGFMYKNWDPATSGLRNIFLTNTKGQAIVGLDCALGYITNQDVFTVKQSIGFYADATTDRVIHGNAPNSALRLFAEWTYAGGAVVSLFGGSHTSTPGQILCTTPGSGGTSTTFSNIDGSGTHSNVIIQNTGEVVVGHDVPASAIVSGDILTVKDQIGFKSSTASHWNSIHGNTSAGALTLSAKTGSSDGPSIEMYGTAYPSSTGDFRAGRVNYIGYGATGYGHLFANFDPTGSGTYYNRMAITNSGKMIIGKDLIDDGITHAPGNYNLYVQNGILTELVKVASSTGLSWADYVFEKDYDLRSINEVETYIKENKHLPDVPTAEQVSKDGIDLAAMDATLLQKIEELTLYIIHQQKEIDELKKKVK